MVLRHISGYESVPGGTKRRLFAGKTGVYRSKRGIKALCQDLFRIKQKGKDILLYFCKREILWQMQKKRSAAGKV